MTPKVKNQSKNQSKKAILNPRNQKMDVRPAFSDTSPRKSQEYKGNRRAGAKKSRAKKSQKALIGLERRLKNLHLTVDAGRPHSSRLLYEGDTKKGRNRQLCEVACF